MFKLMAEWTGCLAITGFITGTRIAVKYLTCTHCPILFRASTEALDQNVVSLAALLNGNCAPF